MGGCFRSAPMAGYEGRRSRGGEGHDHIYGFHFVLLAQSLRIDEVQRAGGRRDVVAWSVSPHGEDLAEVCAVDFAVEVDVGGRCEAGVRRGNVNPWAHATAQA